MKLYLFSIATLSLLALPLIGQANSECPSQKPNSGTVQNQFARTWKCFSCGYTTTSYGNPGNCPRDNRPLSPKF